MFGGKPQLWSAGRDPWELSQAGSVPLPFCWCLLTWQLPLLCRAMVPSGTAHPSPKTTRLWTATSAQDTMPTWNTAFFPLLLVSSQWSSKDGFSWIILVSPSTPFFFSHFHPGFDSWSSCGGEWIKITSAFKVSITLLFSIHFHLTKIHTLNKNLSIDHWTKVLFQMGCTPKSVIIFFCDLERNPPSPSPAAVKCIL